MTAKLYFILGGIFAVYLNMALIFTGFIIGSGLNNVHSSPMEKN